MKTRRLPTPSAALDPSCSTGEGAGGYEFPHTTSAPKKEEHKERIHEKGSGGGRGGGGGIRMETMSREMMREADADERWRC